MQGIRQKNMQNKYMLNVLPVNILPINLFPADIGQIICKTLDYIKELQAHCHKEYPCVNKIYNYIEKQDIPTYLKYLDHCNDTLIFEALVKLNKVLVKTYKEIKEFKQERHIKCINYTHIIENIYIKLCVLKTRMELHNFNEHNKKL